MIRSSLALASRFVPDVRTAVLALAAVAALAPAATLAPVNPSASAKAKAIYTYLQNIKGQGILSGQEAMMWDSHTNGYSSRDQYVFGKNGGKYPAIYETDFGDVNKESELAERVRVVQNIKARASKNTIFIVNWHAVRPDIEESGASVGGGYYAVKKTDGATGLIDKMLTTGDPMNVEWLKRLDAIAGYLKQLRDADIVVLWRPFHENNGNFFWWGQQPRFQELWRQMYDRFTRHHGLDNLLWVYNANHFGVTGTDAQWVRKNYPGDSLVDVMSVDVYHPYFNFEKHMYDSLVAIGRDKPVGVSENGLMPDVPKLFNDGQKFVFFCTWWGFETSAASGGLTGNSDAMYTTNYGSPYTITEDEIQLNVQPDGKKSLTVTAGIGGSVTRSPEGRVDAGTNVTLTAVPADGFEFSRWEGAVAGTTNPLTYKVEKDTNIHAVFVPKVGMNLLKNGDFSDGLTSWGQWIDAAKGNAATISVSDGAARIVITKTDTAVNYGIQLTQGGFSLDLGIVYMLTFDAWASETRSIGYGLVHDGSKDNDWNQPGHLSETAHLTTTKQPFTALILASRYEEHAVLQFNLGKNSLATVHIDNVQLFSRGGVGIGTRATRTTTGHLSARALPGSIEWTSRQPIQGNGILRVLDIEGRELSRTAVPARSSAGRIAVKGEGVRILVLEAAGQREIARVPSVR